MLNDLVVCTRFLKVDELVRVTRAGFTVRSGDGRTYTYVLDNHDKNTVVCMDRQVEPGMLAVVYHVFVGRLLERMNARDFDVFRFHADSWPVNAGVEDEPFVYGQEVHREVQQGQYIRHGFERLGGLALTDPTHVSCMLMAGSPAPVSPVDLIPDREVYKALSPWLNHPGMATNQWDALEEYMRLTKEPQPARVM